MSGLLNGPEASSAASGGAAAGRVEQAIVVAANLVWAVIGLLLWVPQVVRVVLASVVRLVHAALTRQPAEAVRGPIRRVSRFYVDGFLHPGRPRAGTTYRTRELRLTRFLGEALWVAGFWLLLLALVRREAFDRISEFVAAAVARGWGAAIAAGARLFESFPDLLSRLPEITSLAGVGIAAGALVVGAAAGYLLGRWRS